jgi:hypothetical protein
VDLCCNVVVVQVEAVGGGDPRLEVAEWQLDLHLPMAVGSAERLETCCSLRRRRGDADAVLCHPVLRPALHCGKSPY